MPDFIWELVRRDGSVVDIPPAAVETVQRRWDMKQPIHTSNGSIPYGDIADFRKTSRIFGQRLLVDEAAQAFKEPILTDVGIASRWVKKQVSMSEFQRHYSAIPAYRALENEDGMIWVAFKLAVHDINTSKLTYCTTDEIGQLTKS